MPPFPGFTASSRGGLDVTLMRLTAALHCDCCIPIDCLASGSPAGLLWGRERRLGEGGMAGLLGLGLAWIENLQTPPSHQETPRQPHPQLSPLPASAPSQGTELQAPGWRDPKPAQRIRPAEGEGGVGGTGLCRPRGFGKRELKVCPASFSPRPHLLSEKEGSEVEGPGQRKVGALYRKPAVP